MGDDLMAKMAVKGTEELALKYSRLGQNSVEICKKAVMAGAGVVCDEVRNNLRKTLRGSEYSTGDLEKSLGITPPDVDRKGNINAKIGVEGYDSKGVPNALKARALESGTSKQKKKPFVRPAVRATKDKAQKEMEKVFDEEVEKTMK